MHVVLERRREPPHEGRSRRDDVGVKRLRLDLVGHLDALLPELLAQFGLLLFLLLRFLRGAEPARALLVHLRARRDAVDGHVQELSRAHHREQPVDVVEDALEHLLFRGRRGLRRENREARHGTSSFSMTEAERGRRQRGFREDAAGDGRRSVVVADANETSQDEKGGGEAEPRDRRSDAVGGIFGCTYPVLRVETRMDDPVHVQVEVVEFLAVRVGRARVHGARRAVRLEGLIFDHVLDDERVLLREPPVERGDTHRRSLTPPARVCARVGRRVPRRRAWARASASGCVADCFSACVFRGAADKTWRKRGRPIIAMKKNERRNRFGRNLPRAFQTRNLVSGRVSRERSASARSFDETISRRVKRRRRASRGHNSKRALLVVSRLLRERQGSHARSARVTDRVFRSSRSADRDGGNSEARRWASRRTRRWWYTPSCCCPWWTTSAAWKRCVSRARTARRPRTAPRDVDGHRLRVTREPFIRTCTRSN